MPVVPFTIAVPEAELEDLAQRLRTVRWPSSFDADGWDDGASLAFMRRLADYWLNQFDWRAQERRLNQLPQFKTTIDDQEIHFVHRRGVGPAPLPIIVTHGWPGSFVEMERLISLLADPGAHGGDPADAFDVVVPSLPGYGFSPAPTRPGVSSREIAMLWQKLMLRLGYDRFGAQGGDIGAGVSTWLARLFPDSVHGIHLNFVPGSYRPPLGGDAPPHHTRRAGVSGSCRVMVGGRGRLRRSAWHEAADFGLLPHRLPHRAGRLGDGEVQIVERLQRRSRKRHIARRPPHRHLPLLVRQRSQRVASSLQGKPAPPAGLCPGRADPSSARRRGVSARNRDAPPLLARPRFSCPDLHPPPHRRTFRRFGKTRIVSR